MFFSIYKHTSLEEIKGQENLATRIETRGFSVSCRERYGSLCLSTEVDHAVLFLTFPEESELSAPAVNGGVLAFKAAGRKLKVHAIQNKVKI